MQGSILSKFRPQKITEKKRGGQRQLDNLVWSEDQEAFDQSADPSKFGSEGSRYYNSKSKAPEGFNSRGSNGFQSTSGDSTDQLKSPNQFNSGGSSGNINSNISTNSSNFGSNLEEDKARAQLFFRGPSKIVNPDTSLPSTTNARAKNIEKPSLKLDPPPSTTSPVQQSEKFQPQRNGFASLKTRKEEPHYDRSPFHIGTSTASFFPNHNVDKTGQNNRSSSNYQQILSCSEDESDTHSVIDPLASKKFPSIDKNDEKNASSGSLTSLSSNPNLERAANLDDIFVRNATMDDAIPGLNFVDKSIRSRLSLEELQSSSTMLAFLRAKIAANGSVADQQLCELEESIHETHTKLETIESQARVVSEKATDLIRRAEAATTKVSVLDDWLDGLTSAGSGMKIQLIEWGVRLVSMFSAFFIVVWHTIKKPFKKRDTNLLAVDPEKVAKKNQSHAKTTPLSGSNKKQAPNIKIAQNNPQINTENNPNSNDKIAENNIENSNKSKKKPEKSQQDGQIDFNF